MSGGQEMDEENENGNSSMLGGDDNENSNMEGGRRRRSRRSRKVRRGGGWIDDLLKKKPMAGGAKITTGSKVQVWNGTAKHTSGGLTKKDLMRHKGRIVSRKKHAAGKKAIKNLRKAGYIAKKGTFKLFRKK